MEWCVDHVSIMGDLLDLVEPLQHGVAVVVSDGSFVHPYATAAFVLEDQDRRVLITNKVVAPGVPGEMSAYRGEITGLLSSIYFLHHICGYFGITQGNIIIGCDGSSTLSRAFADTTPASVEAPSYDLLMAIHHFRAKSGLTWQTTWIKGHQDDNTDFEQLDRLSQLNAIADQMAKSMLPMARSSNRRQNVEGAPWSVWHLGSKLPSPVSQIYEIVHSQEALKYWQQKGKVEPLLLDFIDWKAIGDALSALPKHGQHFVSKHTAGICGVGKWMHRWKEWPTAQCPRCGTTEDASHVLLCQGSEATVVWDKAMQSLQVWMTSVHTDPDISKAIVAGLQHWRNGTDNDIPTEGSTQYALAQQTDIGWGNLLEGWISSEWAIAQQTYYDSIHSRRSGTRWASSLLRRIWMISWEMWDHRNTVLHQQENVVSNIHESLLHRKIQRMHSKLGQLSLRVKDSYLCSLPLPVLLKKTWSYKTEWLRSAEIVSGRMQGQMQHTIRNLRYMHSVMRRWLHR